MKFFKQWNERLEERKKNPEPPPWYFWVLLVAVYVGALGWATYEGVQQYGWVGVGIFFKYLATSWAFLVVIAALVIFIIVVKYQERKKRLSKGEENES